MCSNLSHTHSRVTSVSHSVGVLWYYSPQLFKTSWWNRPKEGPLWPLQSWLLCVPTCLVLTCSVPYSVCVCTTVPTYFKVPGWWNGEMVKWFKAELGSSLFLCRTSGFSFNKGCVTLCLAIYVIKYLKAKEELWKLKYFTMQIYNPEKKTKVFHIITL